MTSLAYIAVGAVLGVFRPSIIRGLEHWFTKALDALLPLLLLSSSLTFGSDPEVVGSLLNLGMVSAVTAVFTVAASAGVGYLWHRWVGTKLGLSAEKQSASTGTVMEASNPSPPSKMSAVLPASAVIGGWALGIALQTYPLAAVTAGKMAAPASSFTLSALLCVVGYDLGKQRIWLRLREFGPMSATLPLAVGAASMLAASVVSFYMSRDLVRGLSAGAGFGWYSLAGAMTLAQKGTEAGAYVFLSNLLREVLTLLVVPLLAGRTAPEVAASMGGATSMDSTLPAISRSFGRDGAAWGLITGTVLSLFCPFVLGFLFRL